MESEIELHDIIAEMHAIATVPELYPILVNLKAVLSLLELLSHENTDIAVAVVNLLHVSSILVIIINCYCNIISVLGFN